MYYFQVNHSKWFFYLSFLIVGTIQSNAQQCPTLDPSDITQEFCDADSPRILDLAAIDGGNGISWYASPASTTALTTNIILQDGTTYYLGNTSGTCATRLAVQVSISGKPPTDVSVAISRCSSENNTISQLSANGTNLEWFSERVDGVLLPLSAPLVNGITYWVQQTVGTCTSIRLPTSVTIIDPGEPTGASEQYFCLDTDSPTIFFIADLQASGTDISWYDSPTSNSPLDPSTPIVNNATYYATQNTFPCESTGRYTTIVRIEDLSDPGVDANLDLCNNTSNSINLLDLIGGDNGGIWTGPEGTTNGDLGTLDTSLLEIGSYVFNYTIAALNACPEVNATATITILTEPNAGENGILEICVNEAPVDLFTIIGGAPDTTGSWLPALTSGSGVFNPALDTSGTYTYTVAATAPCTVSDSATITVTLEQTPLAGEDVAVEFCISDSAVNLFTLLIGADTGGTWSPALTSGSGVFDPAVDIARAYTYSLAATATCPSDDAIVTVSIITQPEAGEDAAVSICNNDTPIDLFTLIGGTPDTGGTWSPALTSGTGMFDPATDIARDYTYTLAANTPCTTNASATISVSMEQALNAGTDAIANYCTNDLTINLFTLLGTADTGGTWSPALQSGTGVFDPAIDLSGDYTYTMAATAVCEGDTATVTLTVSEQPFAGDDTTIELCTNNDPIDLYTLLGTTANPGGSWSPALTSGTGVFDPISDAGTAYTYTVSALGTCPADEAIVTINLNIAPNAGNDTSINICGDDAALELFALLGASANPGGTWSGPSVLNNGDSGTFNPTINISGSYVYTSLGNGGCEDSTATIEVTIVNPTPTLPTDGEIFCIVDNPLISDLINRVLPEMNGTLQVYTTATALTALNETTALIANNTYYISETDITTLCEGTNRLEVTIQINNPQAPLLSDANAELCLAEAPIVADLNAFIVAGSNIIWLDSNENVLNNSDPLIDGNYFAIEEDINGCRSISSSRINVFLNNPIPPELIATGNEFCGIEKPTILELEANIIVQAGLSIVWYDSQENGSPLSTTDLLLNNGIYFAASFDAITGCESNDRLAITVDLTVCDPSVYPLLIPDGFSPNGDGINDTYDLRDVEFLYENYDIEIYNRYGNLIFKGNNATPSWDGTSNQTNASGKNAIPNGVYFYIFNFNRDNIPAQQGRIYLNR